MSALIYRTILYEVSVVVRGSECPSPRRQIPIQICVNHQMSARSVLACWDNSTRGLDASSALEFAQALRLTTNLLQDAAVVAIYQAGEQVYEGSTSNNGV